MDKGASEYKFVHLRDYEPVSDDVLSALPEGVIRRQLIVPLAKNKEGRLVVAAVPKKEGQIKPEGIQLVVHCPVEMVLAPQEEIQAFIELHYPDKNSSLKPVVADIPEKTPAPKSSSNIPPPLERLLDNAVLNRAAQILLEKDGMQIRIRQRIRGVLVTDMRASLNTQEATAIFDFVGKSGDPKNENSVRWAESLLEFKTGDETFVCEFLLSETSHFGLLTIQLSKNHEKKFSPASWGMGPQQAQVLENFLGKSRGLILFCGTDLDDVTANIRACAQQLATPERHLIAVETRRNHWFPGVEQFVSDNDTEQLSRLLKLAFRHGPDVVVANPLERKEQVDICMSEALKGRLVLARTFAHDASDAMMQLLGMGVEPYLIGAALLGIVAQRTLRLNCPRCQDKDVVPRDRLKELGIPIAMQPAAFFCGKGCDNCLKTGFDRETNIFEILEMSDELRNRLSRDMKSEVFRSMVKSNGMMTLRQVAIHKAINGQTSLAEILRTTP